MTDLIQPESKPNVRECTMLHKLVGHQTHVGCLAWSLEDDVLVTSAEADIRMFNTEVRRLQLRQFRLVSQAPCRLAYASES